jgi:PAS domain S-box-containing protein
VALLFPYRISVPSLAKNRGKHSDRFDVLADLNIKGAELAERTLSDIHGDSASAASPAGLGDRKELTTVAFERTRMPMVVADARQTDCPIVLANRAFLDLTGYSADEVIGRNCRFLQGESTSPEAVAQIRLAIAERREVNVELLNYRKDGSQFWNQLHLSPIDDDNGDVAYFFASQIDATEFRRIETLEASEHRLLMEVDHRAKNVLAVVDSIVRLSRSDDAPRYAAAVQQRIQALSVAHSLLADMGWRNVPLREVVLGQIGLYKLDGVELSGPDIPVRAEIVQPLSLAFHELISNAAAHGALSMPEGRLALSWIETEDDGFSMTWIEYGTQQASSISYPGFGTAILKALVEKQMAGRFRQKWNDAGLFTILEVPRVR